MKQLLLKIEHIASKKIVACIGMATILVCFIAKLFMGTVSFDGSSIYCLMTSDYWNIGKELLHDKIMYNDIVDHKGIYLYWIYSILVWISNNNIAIIAFVEAIVYALTIIVFFKVVRKNGVSENSDNSNRVAVFATSIFAVAYLLVSNGVTLVNTEGIMLPIAMAIWSYVKNTKYIETKYFAIIGVVLGIFFNFKITSIVLFFPMFVYACYKHVQNKGSIKSLAKPILAGIAGFVGINLPFVIYLIVTKSALNFLNIYKVTLSYGKQMEYFLIVIIMITICFALYCYRKNKVELCDLCMCIATMGLYACFGDTSNYYYAIYIGILFLGIFQKEKTNLVVVSIVFVVSLLSGWKSTEDFYLQRLIIDCNQKAVAEKYEIDNSNILYIWEDHGYGVYSQELYKEPLQWLPVRMLCSDDFKAYYVDFINDRLNSKAYKYVYALPPQAFEAVHLAEEQGKYTEEESKENEMYFQIEDSLNENYDNIEDTPWLYIAK